MSRSIFTALQAERLDDSTSTPVTENVAEEIAIALLYNGRSHAVMMATPTDLEDFGIGFSLTEGIVERSGEVELVDCIESTHGIALHLLIPQARFDALDPRQRELTGRTGCGLCGAATLQAAVRPVRHVPTTTTRVPRSAIQHALQSLHFAQPLNQATGAAHAAALLCEDGSMFVREDIGRHNAIDKAVGAAMRAGRQGQVLAVTSRASYEVVHKAAEAGCQVVVAISAPTAFAIRIAEEAGISLAGFARGTRITVYTHAQGISE